MLLNCRPQFARSLVLGFLFACFFLIPYTTEHGFKSIVPLNPKDMLKNLQWMPETAGVSDYVFLSILIYSSTYKLGKVRVL